MSLLYDFSPKSVLTNVHVHWQKVPQKLLPAESYLMKFSKKEIKLHDNLKS